MSPREADKNQFKTEFTHANLDSFDTQDLFSDLHANTNIASFSRITSIHNVTI